MNIDWTQHAMNDRDENMEHVGKDSPTVAVAMDEEIEQQVDTLITYPRLGRPGRIPGTRELVISRTPYIAIYQIGDQDERIEILRVLTNWQQWP